MRPLKGLLACLRTSGPALRCSLFWDANGPSRRPWLWVVLATILGFLLSRHIYCRPYKSGILFLRHPSLLTGPQPNVNSSFEEVERRYFEAQRTDHIECLPQYRAGASGDGGWDLCLAERMALKPPCLVYSFGVEFVWAYDEELASNFGCEVRAFDPSMDMKTHVHEPGPVHFFPLGLAGTNSVWRNQFVRHLDNFHTKIPADWNMRTLNSLIEMNNDQNKVIDVLKIDIEYSEWEVFEQVLVKENLKKVKMLLFETHTNELNGKASTKQDYLRYLSIIRRIEALGFRKYKSHFNKFGVNSIKNERWQSGRLKWYQLPSFSETCCYEQFYVNIHFLF